MLGIPTANQLYKPTNITDDHSIIITLVLIMITNIFNIYIYMFLIYLFIYLSIYLLIYLSIYLLIYLSIYLFIYLLSIIRLFTVIVYLHILTMVWCDPSQRLAVLSGHAGCHAHGDKDCCFLGEKCEKNMFNGFFMGLTMMVVKGLMMFNV